MTKNKSTKRALLMSALALLLCVSMLVGSTFAWFTDSVTSAGNVIQSGTLDVDLVDATGASLAGQVIGWDAADGRAQDEILWEPGCTYNTTEFYVVNNGSLNLKYKVLINGIDGDSELLDVIDFTLNGNDIDDGVIYTLAPNTISTAFVLTGHMQEEAGNQYQGKTITGISITVVATQDTVEIDSFGPNYDLEAPLAYEATGVLKTGDTAVEVQVLNKDNTKLASVVVPAAAVADEKVNVIVTKTEPNFTVETGMEAKAFDVSVTGLVANNTTPIKVQLRIPAGLDPNTVKLYHYDQLVADADYNPNTGYITFETTSFSPFTAVYDAESVYVPPVADESDLPTAVVTEYTPAEPIVWGNYGQWSPTAGLEANLDAIYKFTSSESADEAAESPYANWYCDFYVSLDKDLGENEIFLGGNYGSFGWIGFHNGELTLEANTEIGLLESVTVNPWTYADVMNFVGEFICGVGNVDNSLEGATFPVMLRLTNPAEETEFYNVAEITYTW